MTHVSIDWFSNDIDVMGDTYATNIRPTEVSFIDNEKEKKWTQSVRNVQ